MEAAKMLQIYLFEGLFSPLAVALLILGGSVLYLLQKKTTFSSPEHQKDDVKIGSSSTKNRQTPRVYVSKESEFPNNWLTGKDVFDLEKRAIFSKTWLFITHRSRFTKPGDYHSFELAGFPFFLILGKDKVVRAFHNVCRHRAYTITKKESGSSLVLGCRYHGWSYNTTGGLVKAPHFDDVPGFDKSQNGLFEIHTRMSEAGLIYINLDASHTVPDADTSATDDFMRTVPLACEWVGGLTLEGNFNWKLAASLQFVNTSIVDDILPHSLETRVRSILGNSARERSAIHSIFPGSKIAVVPECGLWFSLSVLPFSESQSRIRCDIYSTKRTRAVAESFSTKFFDVLRNNVSQMEKGYETIQGDFLNALSHTSDDAATQDLHHGLLIHLKNHLKLEKALGREVIPTLRPSRTSQKYFQADTLCKELDCLGKQAMSTSGASKPGILAW